MINNKGLWVASILFLLGFVLDMWSTFRVGSLAGVLEANPIYEYVGFSGIIFLNFFVLVICWMRYKRSQKPKDRFILLSVLLLVFLVRIFYIVPNNLSVSEKVEVSGLTIEQVKEKVNSVEGVSEKMRVFKELFINLFCLFGFCFASWAVWSLDHDISIKKA